MDITAFQLFKVGLPSIALSEDKQSTTKKFTSLATCCGCTPTTTANMTVPTGCIFIQLKPTKGEFIRQSWSRPSLIC